MITHGMDTQIHGINMNQRGSKRMKNLLIVALCLWTSTVFSAQITIDDISNNTTPKMNFQDCDSNFTELYTFMDGSTWQGTLTNEAGLYAALSDVTDFVQQGEESVVFGTNDTTAGFLSLYGDAGTAGSKVIFYNGGTDDATVNFWTLEPDATDFYLGPNTDADRFIFSSAGDLDLASLTASGLITGGSMTIESNTVDFGDVSEDYVLTFNASTNTWAGEAASGGSGNDIELNGTLATDDTYDGVSITGLNAGETISQWDMVYFDATDIEWKTSDANVTGTWPCRGIAVASGTDGNELVVLTQGVIRNDGWNFSTIGASLYLSSTAGQLTQTPPTASGDCVQIVGWVISDDEAYINISGHWQEVD